MAGQSYVALNRRSLFRVPVALPVEIVESPGRSDAVQATTLDLSESGARMLLPTRLDEEAVVGLTLHLSDDDSLVVAAQARHWVRVANGYATGMAFRQLSPAGARLLAKVIARHQRRMCPEVDTSRLVHYTRSPESRTHPATTIAVSPGTMTVHTLDHLELGDRLSVSLRTAHDSFVFGAVVVDQLLTEERIRAVLALDVLSRSDEMRWRSVLDDFHAEGY